MPGASPLPHLVLALYNLDFLEVAQKVKNLPLPDSSSAAVLEEYSSAGDPGSIPVLGRSPGEVHGYPPQYSCLENPWTKKPGGLQSMGLQSRTRLSD